eukprot:9099696-Lingulodinium_polyedra.AAC.1
MLLAMFRASAPGARAWATADYVQQLRAEVSDGARATVQPQQVAHWFLSIPYVAESHLAILGIA